MAKFLYEGRLVEGVALSEDDITIYESLIEDFKLLSFYLTDSNKREIAQLLIAEYNVSPKNPKELGNPEVSF